MLKVRAGTHSTQYEARYSLALALRCDSWKWLEGERLWRAVTSLSTCSTRYKARRSLVPAPLSD